MDRRFWIAVIGALCFGLLLTQAVRRYLQTSIQARSAEELTEVVVALSDIPLGSEINPQQIGLAKYPKSLLSPESVFERHAVVHRVALTEIPALTPVLKRQLAALGTPVGLSGLLKPGLRAVAVRVDETSGNSESTKTNDYLGSYVDVIAIMPPPLENAKPVSKVILQNIRVLAGGDVAQTRKTVWGKVVWLEVTPSQAEKLKLAEAEGRLQLSIRNATDRLVETTPGATRRDVLADAALEARAANDLLRKPAGLRPLSQRHTLPAATPAPAASDSGTPGEKKGPSIELIEGRKRTRVAIQ
ncbi:MAG: Flp pilus assembly protein CpaB [Acidobacteria bacterium]|nr:Flp pilus assembly protein CpaB [Acidobacteriota bacterium]MBI3422953.1 Flp pilus assembly protein CpaB [Acidobacteriota bacterium]